MEWISVEDRLPLNGMSVLVFCKDLDVIKTAYLNDIDDSWEFSDYEDSCDVTHWMPLPEPPTM